ncbi:MAG: FkbM family methyltransferase [Chloroflexi bacterium]|nr:FkbM family methyltransferase [Chloroflexota bacterium]
MFQPKTDEEMVGDLMPQNEASFEKVRRVGKMGQKAVSFSQPVLNKWLSSFLRHYIRYSPFTIGRTYCWERCSQHNKSFITRIQHKSLIKGSTEDLIQRYLYFFGMWEPNLTRFVRQRLTAGDVFVDVGANIGYFSLLASGLVGKQGRILAFEASPTIYELFLDNIVLNQCSNIVPHNIAAGDTIGTTPVFFSGEHNIGMTNTVQGLVGQFETEVALLPLDTMISDTMWKKVRIVKIDVEGAEFSVVKGLRKLLEKKSNPNVEIVVEVNPNPLQLQGIDPAEILAFFQEFGFFPYFLKCNAGPDDYLSGQRQTHAAMITTAITQQTDVIFSRQQREYLVL